MALHIDRTPGALGSQKLSLMQNFKSLTPHEKIPPSLVQNVPLKCKMIFFAPQCTDIQSIYCGQNNTLYHIVSDTKALDIQSQLLLLDVTVFLPSLLLLLKLLLGVGEVPPVAPLSGELGAVHLRHGPKLPSCLVPEQRMSDVFRCSDTKTC